MKHRVPLWPLLCLLGGPAAASHLTEAQVIAMEEKCQAARQEKLMPEKLDVLDACLAEGKEDEATCEERAAAQGERRIVGANVKIGEYYDLPECVEAYRARKHYQVNPSPRER
jgi:hypothetical protein